MNDELNMDQNMEEALTLEDDLILEDPPTEELKKKEIIIEEDILDFDDDPATLENESIQKLIGAYKKKLAEHESETNAEKKNVLAQEISNILDSVPESIKSAGILYVLIYAQTGLPYINDKNYICIFSRREYAEKAQAQFGNRFTIGEVRHEQFRYYFGAQFYLNGAKGVLTDNGTNYCYTDADKLVRYHEYMDLITVPVTLKNPELVTAVQKFQQSKGMVEFEGKKEYDEQIRRNFKKQFRKAKFIVPLEIDGEPVYEEDGRLNFLSEKNKDVRFGIPNCSSEDGLEGIPVFTDYLKFEDMFGDRQMTFFIMKAGDLLNWEFPNLIINSGLMVVPKKAVEGLTAAEDDNAKK